MSDTLADQIAAQLATQLAKCRQPELSFIDQKIQIYQNALILQGSLF